MNDENESNAGQEESVELPTNSTNRMPMSGEAEDDMKKISEEMGIPLRDSKDEANGE